MKTNDFLLTVHDENFVQRNESNFAYLNGNLSISEYSKQRGLSRTIFTYEAILLSTRKLQFCVL